MFYFLINERCDEFLRSHYCFDSEDLNEDDEDLSEDDEDSEDEDSQTEN